MKVTLTARHADFTEMMKEYALGKAAHLERYFDHLRKLEVILDVEGDRRYSAELIASAVKGQVLVCHSVDDTAMAALDTAVAKMERQLVKFKGKLRRRHARLPAGKRERAELVAGDKSGDLWW